MTINNILEEISVLVRSSLMVVILFWVNVVLVVVDTTGFSGVSSAKWKCGIHSQSWNLEPMIHPI